MEIFMMGFQPHEISPESEPVNNPLETGIINEGSASGPVGPKVWYDSTKGTSYGDGMRFEHEETPTMVKIPSKQDRDY